MYNDFTLKLYIFKIYMYFCKKNMNKFLSIYYPIILAFACMLYSISLHIMEDPEGAQYSAHWPGTILLFAIAIRQRRKS
jgi:hypothetical protein